MISPIICCAGLDVHKQIIVRTILEELMEKFKNISESVHHLEKT